MNKKITFIFILWIFFLNGCNYLRTFPLYSEVGINHPDHILLFNDYFKNLMEKGIKENRLDLDNVNIYSKLKKRIDNYLAQHKNLNSSTIEALNEFKVVKGMTMSEVSLILGEPTKKVHLIDNKESWRYLGDRTKLGEWGGWYYKWAKLTFQNKVLSDIEVQYINIHK